MTSWASLDEALKFGYGVERAFVCPQGHSTKAHASVNSLTGWWFCFSCHARGNVDLKNIEIDPHSIQRQIDKLIADAMPTHKAYTETYLNFYDRVPSRYWLHRFSAQVIQAHRLGQSPDQAFAIIPMRDNQGTVLGVIKRDLTGLDHHRYRYPSGLSVGRYLYNYHRCERSYLMLTEGPTDTIAAEEAGWPTCMSLYGNYLSREQVRLIKRYDPAKIFVALDQDPGGEIGWTRIDVQLNRHFLLERVRWDNYKDLASIPLAERAELLQKVTSPKRAVRLVKARESG